MSTTRITRKGPDYIEFDRAPPTSPLLILTAAERDRIMDMIENCLDLAFQSGEIAGSQDPACEYDDVSERFNHAHVQLRTALGFDDRANDAGGGG